MASATVPSETVKSVPAVGLHLVGLAAIGMLAGLVVTVVPVVGETPNPINLAMTATAGLGLLMIGLGAVLRRLDAVYRGASVAGGVLLVVFSASFLINPLAGLILLTLTTRAVFVTLAVTYLFGPGAEEEAGEAHEPAAEPFAGPEAEAPTAKVIHPAAWHMPKPANLPGAVALKQEVCKPEARLTL